MKVTRHSEYLKLASVYLKSTENSFLSEEELSEHWETLQYISKPNFKKSLVEYAAFQTFFRGKNTSGQFRTPFDPLMATSPLNNPGDYTEANAWQYFWTPAQYDIAGLKHILGGEANFTKKLDAFFTTEALHPNRFLGQEAMIGQYAHGNEPSHHILYLYAYTNQAKTGQKYIHQVVQDFHNNTPDGMIGNDDCGQMSAWYIFSALGFYPVTPGSNDYAIGSPLIKNAIINLENGKVIIINTVNQKADNVYIEKITLNGENLNNYLLDYNKIKNGAEITFYMSQNPKLN